MHDRGLPFVAAPDGVKVLVRLSPRANADRVTGTALDADGKALLKVAVRVPPEKGRANEAMIALLAKTWRLPKSRLTIAAGAASRRKTVTIAGDPQALMQYLSDWMKKLNG